MPPRPRNLKLPLSAFTSSPAAEELSSGPVFKSTIDASVDVAALKDGTGLAFEGWESESGRKVAGGVAVVRSETLPSTSSPQILRTVPLYPIPLPSSVAPAHASLIEFEITRPADESIWAEIERVLDTVVGIAREVRDEEAESKMDLDAAETDELKTREFKNVVLSNLLPPPLLSNLSPTLLPGNPDYQAYTQQITALSLIPGLSLKLLPPSVLESPSATGVGWWEDEEALISVISHYLIPCLDSFGSHRIVFGASPTPLASGVESTSAVFSPRKDWHSLVLKVFRSIKLDAVSVGEIMGASAQRLYELEVVA
ncbi:hypothetical protein BDY24DRAFT_437347 [Mrakia frigida]|uniref:uncharacterized protein n=1 Tax=Mrakia frigida TaxID=29902 RepID=UPI003FCC0652